MTKNSRKQKMRKIRTSKKIKNTLKDFKIFYHNLRVLKSKIDGLDEATDVLSMKTAGKKKEINY